MRDRRIINSSTNEAEQNEMTSTQKVSAQNEIDETRRQLKTIINNNKVESNFPKMKRSYTYKKSGQL